MSSKKAERKGPPKGTTRTIRIDVQYDGTDFVGWQRQPRGASIQGLLEKALSKIASEKITLFGSSRTDAGVHAVQQSASFSLRKSRTPVEAFVIGTNSLLPSAIRVTRAEEADLYFLASADAKRKTYRYFFDVGPIPRVFARNYAWHLRGPVNWEAMHAAAEHLLGTQDFASFRASQSDTKTTVRTIDHFGFRDSEWGLKYFEISANGFLKYMVRSIVGTLVEVGLGKRSPNEMKSILQAKDRRKAGQTAPPQGLFLWRVEF